MKKAFVMVLAVLIGLAFVTTTFAQDKAPAKAMDKPAVAGEKAPGADKEKAAAEKAEKKAKKAEKKAEKKAKKEKKEKAPKEEAKPAAAPAPAPGK